MYTQSPIQSNSVSYVYIHVFISTLERSRSGETPLLYTSTGMCSTVCMYKDRTPHPSINTPFRLTLLFFFSIYPHQKFSFLLFPPLPVSFLFDPSDGCSLFIIRKLLLSWSRLLCPALLAVSDSSLGNKLKCHVFSSSSVPHMKRAQEKKQMNLWTAEK